jgi:hypothetical protein
MRTALLVGESGAFSGRRLGGGAAGGGALSAVFGGGLSAHAKRAAAASATAAAVRGADSTANGTLIGFLQKLGTQWLGTA